MKLAVILPVCCQDRKDCFQLAAESILFQTLKEKQLFVGVDGPVGDELTTYLNELEQQQQVTVKRFPENRGLACVLNDLLGICFSEGYEYIARMDADDIALSDRLEKQKRFLDEHPDIDVVGGAISEIDEQGNSRNKTVVYPDTPEACRKFFAHRNPHAHPAVMFRRSFFEKAGCRYRPEYRKNQDTMLWFDGMIKGTRHANIPDVVLNFRMTDSFFKNRRQGWALAKQQFVDRLKINRGLGYGLGADIYGFAVFCLLMSPAWLKKIAYKLLR